MRTESVTIAGREYAIEELPLRRNAEWRRRLEETIDEFADVLDADLAASVSAGDVIGVIRNAGRIILRSPDTIADLVFAYSPALAADRDKLLEAAYESEIIDAFAACLRLAFPFGRALALASAIGARATPSTAT